MLGFYGGRGVAKSAELSLDYSGILGGGPRTFKQKIDALREGWGDGAGRGGKEERTKEKTKKRRKTKTRKTERNKK